ncbi:MAG: hypothetical protein LQ340_003895 [Diploschistes diacapsis]|nr:MAG: hypothetical protein LQ340_003895 [Diploschistes diacapsis]
MTKAANAPFSKAGEPTKSQMQDRNPRLVFQTGGRIGPEPPKSSQHPKSSPEANKPGGGKKPTRQEQGREQRKSSRPIRTTRPVRARSSASRARPSTSRSRRKKDGGPKGGREGDDKIENRAAAGKTRATNAAQKLEQSLGAGAGSEEWAAALWERDYSGMTRRWM